MRKKQWRNCMAYLEVSVRAAGLIGAGQMLISVGHGGECPAELRRARLRRSVEHLARVAEREHVVLLLETLSPLESNTCTRLHELKELLEAVDSPWLMGMCDVVPPVLQGEDPVDYCRHLGSRMAHLRQRNKACRGRIFFDVHLGRRVRRNLLYRFCTHHADHHFCRRAQRY